MKKINIEKIDLKKFAENIDKIDAATITTKEELITTIVKLYALEIDTETIENWAKKSAAYNPAIIDTTFDKFNILNKLTHKFDLDAIIRWFCNETHTKLYEDQIRYEKNTPFLIDCLDYDRYDEIFYNGGQLYSVKKNSTIEKDSKEAIWQETRLHIKAEIASDIKFNKLPNRTKIAFEKFKEETNKDVILTDEQKAYKINAYKSNIISEAKETICLSDFYIETKKYIFYIIPTKFNDEKYSYNTFRPGLVEQLNFSNKVEQCPTEFVKLLDNLAGEQEKEWLINHMAAYLQNFMSGWKLYDKIQTIPVFCGKEGTGKNTIMEFFAQLVTSDFLCEVDRDMFDSGFSEWKKAAVILLNEFGGTAEDRRDFSNKLKLMTSPSFNINEKYKPSINIENKSYIAIAGNESNYGLLNLGVTDRRYQYITGGKNVSKNEAWKVGKVFDKNILKEQLYDFCNFLMNFEVDWDKADTVFMNDAKAADMSASKDQYDQAIDLFLQTFPERNTVTATEMYSFAADNGLKFTNAANFGRRLAKRFGKAISRKHSEFFNGSVIELKHCNSYKIK